MAGYLGGMIQRIRGQDDDVTEEQRTEGRGVTDGPMERQHVGREAPSSQVGYGGGDRTSEYAQDPPAGEPQSVVERNDNLGEGKAHGGRFVGGHGTSDPRLSEDQPKAAPGDQGLPNYGGTTESAAEQDQSEYSSTNRNVAPPATESESGNYGTTDAKAIPPESGVGRSAPGGYVDAEGAQRSSEYATTDANSKPSDSGYGSSGPGGYTGEGGVRRSSEYGADANAKPSECGEGSSGPGGYTGEGGAKVSLEEQRKCKYGTCGSNSFPREAGSGLSSPGGYAGEGGAVRDHTPVPMSQSSEHVQGSSDTYGGLPVPTRPPGAVLLDENHFAGPKLEPTSTGGYEAQPTKLDSGRPQESEVRGGIPHGIVSGHPSGAGQNNYGGSDVQVPMSSQVGHQGVKPQEYHQTGSLPSHGGGSAYSQQYTQPGGPDTHASELEGVNQPPGKPSPIGTTNLTPAATEDTTHKEEGFMAKVKSHLPGHKHHTQTVGGTSHSAPSTPAAEHEKPSFMEKIKTKLSPGHHKEANEH